MLPEDQQKLYWDVILSGLARIQSMVYGGRMIKGYEYQSDIARMYVSEGRAEGRAQGLRWAITEVVCARFPRLRNELERQIRDQSVVWLVQLAGKVGKAQDEDAVRAVLGLRSKRRGADSARAGSGLATRRRGRRGPSSSRSS
ncbi:MAG TPA: hypothetical protein VNO30_26855 [Kofleriaceae bacterium]|nr:hypothetical protein [Kofleriaceae bacterium]